MGMACLCAALAVQTGCRYETNEAETAKITIANSESPESSEAVEPPTDPIAKTEAAAKKAPAEFVNASFEVPIRLMVGTNPLNTAARQMYPSPAVYDVDHDGQSELIVGDIFGSLNVYENQNDGSGDPVWGKHTALKSTDGNAIKVSNW